PRITRHLRRLGGSPAVTRERDYPRAEADVRPVEARLPVDDTRGVGRGRGIAAGPHGELRGRSPEPGRGPHGPAGPPPDRSRARRRIVLREPRARRSRGARAAPERNPALPGTPLR